MKNIKEDKKDRGFFKSDEPTDFNMMVNEKNNSQEEENCLPEMFIY